MTIVGILTLASLVVSVIYLPVKVLEDIRANRAGWAVLGCIAFVGLLAPVLLGLVMMFDLLPFS